MAGMSAIGRPKTPLVLTEEERTVLERWSRRGRTAQSLGPPLQDRAGECGR
jgi:hypothetical protein